MHVERRIKNKRSLVLHKRKKKKKKKESPFGEESKFFFSFRTEPGCSPAYNPLRVCTWDLQLYLSYTIVCSFLKARKHEKERRLCDLIVNHYCYARCCCFSDSPSLITFDADSPFPVPFVPVELSLSLLFFLFCFFFFSSNDFFNFAVSTPVMATNQV